MSNYSLSNRQKAIISLLEKTNVLVDIGAESGAISLKIAESNIANQIIAVENKLNPFKLLQKNVFANPNIKSVFSNGLDQVDTEFTALVVGGLGGYNVINIMTNHISSCKKTDYIVVQANTNILEMKDFFFSNGFYIDDSNIIEESNHFYLIFRFKYDPLMQKEDIFIDKRLVNNSIYQKYLNSNYLKFSKIEKHLKKKNNIDFEYLLNIRSYYENKGIN